MLLFAVDNSAGIGRKAFRRKEFTMENTEGFTQADIDLMNEALAVLLADGVDEANAAAIINNNWMSEGNTVESLTRR